MGKTSFIWKVFRKMNARMARNYRRGVGPRKLVLLLTTRGRKSGMPRTTPLQYELINGYYYLGSARGVHADWYRNVEACSEVEVQIGEKRVRGRAEAVSDPERVADFLGMRLKLHPVMIGLLMRLEGLPLRYTRADLEKFAAGKAMVVFFPEVKDESIMGRPHPGIS